MTIYNDNRGLQSQWISGVVLFSATTAPQTRSAAVPSGPGPGEQLHTNLKTLIN